MKLSDTGLTAKLLKEKAKQYMIETYERFDMVADHAKGVYLYDEQDTPYLDFYAGIAVNSVGNCNERVVKAVQEQAGTLMQVFNYPYSVPQALLAEKICTTIGMDKIFYQNSGTEANEAMIKMARKYGVETYGPHKYHIVTAANSFHGRTFGSMSATGQPDNACQVGFGDMTPGFSYAPYNDLEAFKAACNENTIAIMIEPVQGEGGVNPATPEFMTGLRQFCDENGLLLLLDEVQTGWCRTGNWMSFMNYGIKPDIVSMAKALGGGMQLTKSLRLSAPVHTVRPLADIRSAVQHLWQPLGRWRTNILQRMPNEWVPTLWICCGHSHTLRRCVDRGFWSVWNLKTSAV